MALKMTCFYQIIGVGDSETYYLPDGDPQTLLDGIGEAPNAGGALNAFLSKRVACLNKAASLTAVRLAMDDSSRTSAYRLLPPVPANNTNPIGGWQGSYIPNQPNANTGPTETYSNLMLRWSFVGSIHRQTWMMAVPEEIVAGPQSYSPTANWTAALNNWLATFAGVALTAKTRKGQAIQPVPITFFVVDPGALFAYVQPIPAPLSGLAPGAKRFVILRGIKAPRGWNQVHNGEFVRVGAGGPVAAGDYCRIGPLRKAGVSAPLWTSNPTGTIQQFVPGNPALIYGTGANALPNVRAIRLSEHKRGRPFGQPRGRR